MSFFGAFLAAGAGVCCTGSAGGGIASTSAMLVVW